MANRYYKPEIHPRTTLQSFAVIRIELEVQLPAKVVKADWPDL